MELDIGPEEGEILAYEGYVQKNKYIITYILRKLSSKHCTSIML